MAQYYFKRVAAIFIVPGEGQEVVFTVASTIHRNYDSGDVYLRVGPIFLVVLATLKNTDSIIFVELMWS